MMQVHPPTYHQPYRSSAVREESAAAAAAAAAALPAATKAAPSADSLAEPADAGNEKAVQDAAHLTARAAPVDALPPSSHGPSAPLSEVNTAVRHTQKLSSAAMGPCPASLQSQLYKCICETSKHGVVLVDSETSGALQETFEMWPQSAGEASAEHVIQPDSPAILPAGAYMLSAWLGMPHCFPLLAAFGL